MTPRPTQGFDVTGLLVLALLTSLVYWPGLNGPFVFDDSTNIVNGPFPELIKSGWSGLWRATLSGEAGPLRRPISMLSFGLNALTSGLGPFSFKLTNLVIHLLNGLLVWFLVRRLLSFTLTVPPERQALLALAACGLWLLHPLQLTSVLFVVQRMTSLSATFVLLGLYCYVRARAAMLKGHDSRILLWCGVSVCLLLAALSKENGVLLVAYCLAIELSLLGFCEPRPARPGSLRQFHAAFVGLPLVLLAVYLARHPEVLTAAVPWRDFLPLERLMTEARVLLFYLKLLFIPDISTYGLFYDDFTVSRSLLSPPETLVAILTWLGLIVMAFVQRRRWPWFAFAVFWYFAGHSLEASFVMLELVHLHRNYLPCLGPILALVVGLNSLLAATSPRMPLLISGVLVLAMALITALRADQWRDPVTLARFELLHRPNSPRAQYEGGRVIADLGVKLKNPDLTLDAAAHLRRSAELAPNDLGALLALGIISGRPFSDADFAVLEERLTRRAVHGLDINFLNSFMNCRARTRCAIPSSQIQAIFSLILKHPGLTPPVRAEVLSMLGIYYARNLADVPACVALLREATTLQPENPQMFLNYAQALLFVPDYDGASNALDEAARLDTFGIKAGDLSRFRADIIKMRAAARTVPASQ